MTAYSEKTKFNTKRKKKNKKENNGEEVDTQIKRSDKLAVNFVIKMQIVLLI